jgi:methionine salvage enolase-phosphatase E1
LKNIKHQTSSSNSLKADLANHIVEEIQPKKTLESHVHLEANGSNKTEKDLFKEAKKKEAEQSSNL